MKFRSDINGLRGFAVIAVVLFHFNPSLVPGGFVGVDIFFVISGFLMTSIIFRGLDSRSFSIFNFYISRANRIIPVLSIVCLTLLIFGWFYFLPLDYKMLGKHVTSSIVFLSNIIYWRESGYFDEASKSKWLLHTWSLSVEWQFYIIYPAVLVILKKIISLASIKRLLVFITIVGFLFNIYATYVWPNAAYFLLPTRVWEILIGGLAFLYPFNFKEKIKKYLELLGIFLIFSSCLLIQKDNMWPGYFAAAPVLGGYLVIIANRIGSSATCNFAMQKIGLWSYSLYLWHWPVVVFGEYFKLQNWEWLGIPISVVLAFFSYRFIESINFRLLSKSSLNFILKFKPFWMMVCIGFIGCIIFIDDGALSLKYQRENKVFIKNIMNASGDWAYPSEASAIFDGAPIRIIKSKYFEGSYNLFVGDSMIEQYYPKIKELVENGKMSTSIFFTEGGCLPIKGFSNPYRKCSDLYKVVSYIKNKKFNNIFIGGLYSSYFADDSDYRIGDRLLSSMEDRSYIIENHLKKIIEDFKLVSKNLFFILPAPHGNEFSPDLIMKDFLKNKINTSYDVSYYREKFSLVYNIVDSLNIKTIDPIPFLCKEGFCNVVNEKWSPYYKDTIHMRPKYVLDNVNYLSDRLN